MEEAQYYNFHYDLTQPLSIACIGQAKTAAHHYYGPAVRGYYLIHYIIEGKGTFIVDGIQYQLQAGQGFLIAPNEQTYYIADEDDPWSYIWFGFGGTHAQDLVTMAGFTTHNPVFQTNQKEKLLKYIQAGLCKFPTNIANQLYLLGLLYQFMSIVANANQEVSTKDVQDTYVKQAIQYIQTHINTSLTVQKIAAHVGINRSYLSTRFKKYTGFSPIKYVQNYRLTLAKHYLEVSDLTIEEIANQCGYQRAESLSKMFKERYHSNPSYYRKKFGFKQNNKPKIQ
ncbi:helix-turn-helix domain-containing protein [Ligilactobacillus agilis]